MSDQVLQMGDKLTIGQIDSAPMAERGRSSLFFGISRIAMISIALVVMTTLIAAGFLVGGFLKFTDTISGAKVATMSKSGDGIVVYTGGASRIKEALKLLKDGRGMRLLISGVNPDVSIESLLSKNDIEASVFDCCVDIDRKAADTAGNAEEAKKWAVEHNYNSLVIVTSNYHMPRSLLESRRKMPDMALIPHSVTTDEFDSANWFRDRMTLRLLVSEYSKYVAAQLRTALDDRGLTSISAGMFGN